MSALVLLFIVHLRYIRSMTILYKFIDSVNQLPLDRFEVKPDASIFESWDFLRLGDGESEQFYSRAKPGNPQGLGKQLRIQTDLLDWQNQDRSKTYVAMAHQLDFARQREYLGSISKFDINIPDQSYEFQTHGDGIGEWDGTLKCGLPDDIAVSLEICHVQDQELNATASVKTGWQGKFYVMIRVLVDRQLMQSLTEDINSGRYHSLTTSVSVMPWRPLNDHFDNLLPSASPVAADEGYDFPQISETQCSDMFRFTLEPKDEPEKMADLFAQQSQLLETLLQSVKALRPLLIATVGLMLALAVLVVQK